MPVLYRLGVAVSPALGIDKTRVQARWLLRRSTSASRACMSGVFSMRRLASSWNWPTLMRSSSASSGKSAQRQPSRRMNATTACRWSVVKSSGSAIRCGRCRMSTHQVVCWEHARVEPAGRECREGFEVVGLPGVETVVVGAEARVDLGRGDAQAGG